jgi:hypothetical protein
MYVQQIMYVQYLFRTYCSVTEGAIGCLWSFFGFLGLCAVEPEPHRVMQSCFWDAIGSLRLFFLAPWGHALEGICRTVQCKNQLRHFVWLPTINLAVFLEPLWSSCLDTCSLICSLTIVCLPHTHHYRYFFLLSSLSDNG